MGAKLRCDGYRVWLMEYRDWRPAEWCDVPPQAVVLEPADTGCLSADEARIFVETFNQAMLREQRQIWAVSVPVAIRYLGDLRPGDVVNRRLIG